jgi:2-polyprenyl-3-methyl-5-hydroxy-6-metoxy-1,4-benzoquinol methylase
MSSPKHRYDYRVDLDGDTAPARVIRMVPPGSRVLDLGAGPGSIARPLMETRGCSVVALESDPSALRQLAAHGARALAADLNDPSWVKALAGEAPFDAVVLADVLEHLLDPAQALRAAAELVGTGGALIVSLPHVGFAGIIGSALDGEFAYRPWGLLDRTHLRFFGIRDIPRLFEAAGCRIVEAQFVRRAPEETEFGESWSRLSPAQREAALGGGFGDVYQVVTRAQPESRSTAAAVDLEREARGATGPPPPEGAPAPGAGAACPAAPAAGAPRPRLVAFYLPQFHPIPENDAWWGKGFTEWTNVTRARPLFPLHYQPHLPADLGFYDLRVRETRLEQIALARSHGIDAFCYHYYWFSGRRLLHRPLEEMLADAGSDFPFCLCWANESWTRGWDGNENEILIAQRHRPEDDAAFIDGLLPFLRDPRYLRVGGAPLLIVYRPQFLPDPRGRAARWRELCRVAGIGDIFLCAALTGGNRDYLRFGFDGAVEFPPHNMHGLVNESPHLDFQERFTGTVLQYEALAEHFLRERGSAERNVFRCVVPSWDNTARRAERAFILLNGTPGNYEHWLGEAVRRTQADFPGQERLVFINAWNEWAEGCHLEPDCRYGRQFLEATLRVANGCPAIGGFPDRGLPAGSRSTLGRDLGSLFSRHAERRMRGVRRWLDGHPPLSRIAMRFRSFAGMRPRSSGGRRGGT